MRAELARMDSGSRKRAGPSGCPPAAASPLRQARSFREHAGKTQYPGDAW